MEGRRRAAAGLVGFFGMGFDRCGCRCRRSRQGIGATAQHLPRRERRGARWRWMAMRGSPPTPSRRSSATPTRRREAPRLRQRCATALPHAPDQFNVSMNHLQALAILVNTFHQSQTPSAITQVRPIPSHPGSNPYPPRKSDEIPCSLAAGDVREVRGEDSQGPGDAAVAEIRSPADEYAPVIFAQDAYKNVISFDMLSGAVRDHLLPPSLLCSSLAYNSVREHFLMHERKFCPLLGVSQPGTTELNLWTLIS
ncbi:hypothetical protein ZWY2020_046786 [Hordeum vulgare]|nr:hypothetical protein ZWY2020_046786 [Hordeum vulgare]